jgi:hypothetical protein
MLSANRDNLTSSFLIWIPFILSLALLLWLKLSIQFWVKVNILVLLLILEEMISVLCPFSMMLVVGLLYITSIVLRYVPSTPNFEEFSSWKDVEFYWIIFLPLFRWFFVFHSVGEVCWFAFVKPSWHPWVKFRLIMVYNLLYVLLDLICYYFVEIFAICSLYLLVCCILFFNLVLILRQCWVHGKSLEEFPSFQFFGIVWEELVLVLERFGKIQKSGYLVLSVSMMGDFLFLIQTHCSLLFCIDFLFPYGSSLLS